MMPDDEQKAGASMFPRVLVFLLTQLINQLDPQLVREMIDDMLDPIEVQMADKPLVIQLIKLIRQSLNIPDDVGGDED